MNRDRLRKVCFILLALLILAASIGTIFSVAMRANCCEPECVPCLILGKLQESFRQLGGVLGAFAGSMVVLVFLMFMLGMSLRKQHLSSLVILKARLNN